jgi:ubiquinone/menaquinone biosynthesis C-methylase UbiE
MIDRARQAAAGAGVDVDFQVFRLGPGGEDRLPYGDASFDLVMCNSTLHHLADPAGLLDEMARVAMPQGAVLIRDLARPIAPAYPLHVRIFGRHYRGEMRRLYEASVRAAYTPAELEVLLTNSKLDDGRSRVFRRGLTHAGIERAAVLSV